MFFLGMDDKHLELIKRGFMESLLKWKSGLRAKLLLIGFVPLVLMIIVIYWAAKELSHLQNIVVNDYSTRTELVRLSGQMDTSLSAMGRWIWLSYAVKNESEKKTKFISNARKEIEKLDRAANEFSVIKKSNDIENNFQKVLENWTLAKTAVLVGLDQLAKDSEVDQENAKKYILSNATPLLVPITVDIQMIIAQIGEVTARELVSQKMETQKNINLLIVLSVIAILWIILFTVFIASKLVKIFSSLSLSLTHSSEDLGTTSAHMSSISYELSQTASTQASTLEQISSSLEEVSAMVGKNTDNSKRSANESSAASAKAQHGQEVVGKLLESIEAINKSNYEIMNQVDASNDKFNDIIKVIKEIETKTRVINDIVFQTKLLSFNASVEAARAGEHGSGFSVVAEEVGKLAAMSGKASTEISHLLTMSIGHVESIVVETKNNVGRCIDDGKNKVEAGMRVAHDCKKVLVDITESIQTASLVAEEISGASEEQTIGVNEILKAVSQLDHMTHKNAQTSIQAAQSAKQLEGYADSVSKNVNSFMYALDGSGLKITRFPWSEKLVLNVSEMDDQHKVLVENMDSFFRYLDDQNMNGAKAAFKKLAESTVFHFKCEEQFLASIAYPNLAAHKKIHQDLVDKVVGFGEDLERGQLDKYQVADFLKNWLSLHIMGQDQHYSRFYHKE